MLLKSQAAIAAQASLSPLPSSIVSLEPHESCSGPAYLEEVSTSSLTACRFTPLESCPGYSLPHKGLYIFSDNGFSIFTNSHLLVFEMMSQERGEKLWRNRRRNVL